jgi:hypothetical protein
MASDNKLILNRGVFEDRKEKDPSGLTQEQLDKLTKQIMKMMPTEPIEKTKPNNVLCKMVMKGKASSLANTLSSIMNHFYKSNSSYSKGFDKELIITLMVEEAPSSDNTQK